MGSILLKPSKKEHILKILDATGRRVSGPKGAATILGLNPSTLRFRIKKLGIMKRH
jgi:transcriptional regulator with GAF, ATPase, and Fis domain